MDIKTVKQLAELMDSYDLEHLEVGEGEQRVVLTKRSAPAAQPAAAAATAVAAPAATAAQAAQQPAAAGEALAAPLVGVAYVAAQPGASPFVQLGQQVKKGQVLCIIEAMKVMNEFCAPRNGTITEICIEDGALVEFGQCLFRLQ